MEQFDAYADQVCSKIRWKKVHPLVREELLEHLMESSEERESEGIGSIESAEAAVSAMGDATLSGAKLNALYKPRFDIVMVIALALLALAAYFVMPLGRWAKGCAGIVLACVGCAAVDLRELLSKLRMHVFIAGIVALFAVLALAAANSMQGMLPSLEYVGVFLCVCGIGAYLGSVKSINSRTTISVATALVLLVGGFMVAWNHSLMLEIIGISLCALFLKAGMPKRYVWALFGIALLFGLIVMVTERYPTSRVMDQIAFIFDPYGTGIGFDRARLVREAWRQTQWFGSFAPSLEMQGMVITWSHPIIRIAMLFGRIPAYLIIAANAAMCWRMLSLSLRLKDALSSCVAFGLSMLVTVMTAFAVLRGVGVLLEDVHLLFLTRSGAYWLLQSMSVATVFALNYNRDYIRLEQGGKLRELEAKKALV